MFYYQVVLLQTLSQWKLYKLIYYFLKISSYDFGYVKKTNILYLLEWVPKTF